MAETIRVFIGTEPKTEIARKVLEHSIRRNTKADVTVTPMLGKAWEYDKTGFSQGTGFSLRRWMIPAACGWKGRAIYLDADQLVFGDIAELAKYGAGQETGCPAWMTYQPSKFSKAPHPNSSVMVIDCAAAKNFPFFHIDKVLAHLRAHPDKKTYANLMFPNWFKPGRLPNTWNSLNTYTAGKTQLLHYTKEPEQAWYNPEHKLAYLWTDALKLAILDGTVNKEEFQLALSKWNVKEDWRSTNGLHPKYAELLPLFPDVVP